MLELQTSGKFEKKCPQMKAWLDREIEKTQQLPTKVEKSNIPRGELYGLTQAKTLFALLQFVKSHIKFNLKGLAASLGVPYGTVRHWVNEARVKEKTREFTEQFVDEFTTRLEWRFRADMLFRTQGWPPPAPDEHPNILKEEIKSFKGLILHFFIEKLSERLRAGSEIRSLFIPLCNQLFDLVQPHNALLLGQLYHLSNQLAREEIAENFRTLNDHIKNGDQEHALEKSKECESDSLGYLNHVDKMSRKYWEAKRNLDFLMQAKPRQFKNWQEERRKGKISPPLAEPDNKVAVEKKQVEIPEPETPMTRAARARAEGKKIKIKL